MSASPPAPATGRRVLAIAGPIMLSNVTVPLLGAVDTGVVGQLGDPAPIGAVGLGAAVIGLVYWLFGFLRMGTTGLVAQARGAGQGEEVSALLSRGLLIALAGANPIRAYGLILKGAFGSRLGLSEMLTRATPLILTGLAAAVAFRARLWNIGGEGQFYRPRH